MGFTVRQKKRGRHRKERGEDCSGNEKKKRKTVIEEKREKMRSWGWKQE